MASRSDDQRRETDERLDRKVVGPIDAALNAVAQERQEIVAEMDAYVSFRGRVRAIDVDSPVTGPPSVRVLERNQDTGRPTALRTAFEETVMAVDHFERVYDESVLTHVASELSPALLQWFRSERPVFDTNTKTALLRSIDRSIAERERSLSVFDDEADQLRQTRVRLTDLLERAMDQPRPVPDDAPLIQELDRLATDRQAVVQAPVQRSAIDGHNLHEYLYAATPSAYPVLSAIASIRRALSE